MSVRADRYPVFKGSKGNWKLDIYKKPSGMWTFTGNDRSEEENSLVAGIDTMLDQVSDAVGHFVLELGTTDYSLDEIPGIELNISCPNVKEGGMAFGTSCLSASQVVKAVRRVYKHELMVKLSPNVTDIAKIAKAVENEGADSISLINTMLGMAIDAEKRKPVLSTITGGLSGPAIKPIALRMVWQVANAVKVPVIGMGGIMNATDAIEFLLAGASAIQIGTANFIDPTVSIKVIEGIEAYLIKHGCSSVYDIIGMLET